ncbi:MAG: GntR family transcriptional regulator [Saprospiraceae bacterium]|nr:GntR family transcriptional regulator [Saprospiraceae bacterium]
MIQLGQYNSLKAVRSTRHGMYLADEEGREVLLPRKYVPKDISEEQVLEVFVFNDSEDRPTATTLAPKILLHQVAYLQVKQVNKFGAFLDWGLDKDLLVPFREQRSEMQKGKSYLVYLYEDEESQRLVATSKWYRFINNEDLTVEQDQEVDLIVANSTNLGVNVIINHKHVGLVYKNEIFRRLRPGDHIKGFVKLIRPDNKIDIRLQREGYAHVEPNAEKILQILQINDGFLGLHDGSSPDDIRAQLEMSKKTFKKAIGALYKKKLIEIKAKGIYLVKE